MRTTLSPLKVNGRCHNCANLKLPVRCVPIFDYRDRDRRGPVVVPVLVNITFFRLCLLEIQGHTTFQVPEIQSPKDLNSFNLVLNAVYNLHSTTVRF